MSDETEISPFEQLLEAKNHVLFGEQNIHLDPKLLIFDEQSLNAFWQKEGVYHAYFGSIQQRLEGLQQKLEHQYEVELARKFKEAKAQGASDKLAEATAKADETVEQAKTAALDIKYRAKAVAQYLRAMAVAHENSANLGHNLRKEMGMSNLSLNRPAHSTSGGVFPDFESAISGYHQNNISKD